MLLVPIYVIFLVTALDTGDLSSLLGSAAILLLVMLTQYAIYRARDYRLTRTVFRGLRFHQTGSGWRYAVCAVFWWGLTVLSFGFAYPFARASLERFKMRHTHYGDLPGRFEASGFWLFLRGMPMWLLVIMPTLAAIAALLGIDWAAVAAATDQRGDDVFLRLEQAQPGISGFARFRGFGLEHRDHACACAVSGVSGPGDPLVGFRPALRQSQCQLAASYGATSTRPICSFPAT